MPRYPTVRELAQDAATELSGWDGRIAVTLRTLLLKPGKLTREFLEGRRARYLAPFRLYLIASAAYFVLAASAPDVKLDSGETLMIGFRFSATQTDSAGNPDPGSRGQPLTAEERAELLAEIDGAWAPLRPLLIKSIDDPTAIRRAVFQTMPKVLFVLLPFFAFVVSLFYRGRSFPEHLYFAIHLHAFLFLALAFTELLKFTRVAGLVIAGGVVSAVAILVYAELAFRAVYGGGFWMRQLKNVGIGALYAIAALLGFAASLLWLSTQFT